MKSMCSQMRRRAPERCRAMNAPGAIRRRKATCQARRDAMPRPAYEWRACGAPWLRVLIEAPGWATAAVGSIPPDRPGRRYRSDQYAVSIDGEDAGVLGLVEIFSRLRKSIPPRLTLRQAALM